MKKVGKSDYKEIVTQYSKLGKSLEIKVVFYGNKGVVQLEIFFLSKIADLDEMYLTKSKCKVNKNKTLILRGNMIVVVL